MHEKFVLDCSEGPKTCQKLFFQNSFHRDFLGYTGGTGCTQQIGICLNVSMGTPGSNKQLLVHILPVSA